MQNSKIPLRGYRVSELDNGALTGVVVYWPGSTLVDQVPYANSFVVRVYLGEYNSDTNWQAIYVASFGNQVSAEDRLIELMLRPTWTILKYAKPS